MFVELTRDTVTITDSKLDRRHPAIRAQPTRVKYRKLQVDVSGKTADLCVDTWRKYLAFLDESEQSIPKRCSYPRLRLHLHPSVSQRDAVTLLQDQE